MRIASGTTDQIIYFVATGANGARLTGLSSFTVYRDRNGNGAAVMTTPTVTEVDATNMKGVYKLLLDEDMTIADGNFSEEMVFHISATGMLAVTRAIELYRPPPTRDEIVDLVWGIDLTSYAASGSAADALLDASTGGDLSGIEATLATIDGKADAIKGRTDNLPDDPADESLIIAATDALAAMIDGVPEALFVLADGVESGLTLRAALRGIVAVDYGNATGLDAATAIFRDTNDTKNRVTASQDGSSRTIVLDLS
jgi:hypothetical protein